MGPTGGETAPPPSSPTAQRTHPTFPPARRSQEPPASSPSATRASPTTPAPPPTSSPPPGAPQAPTRTEPTFLEVSLSALPLALVLPQQQPPPHQPPQLHPLPQRPQCPPQPQHSTSTTTAAADLRRTCNTVSGPASGKPCVFPFTWQGKTFTSCTKEGDDQGKLWCSTMVDQAGNHVAGQGQYGFCSRECN